MKKKSKNEEKEGKEGEGREEEMMKHKLERSALCTARP
jgi:hypothetical protein